MKKIFVIALVAVVVAAVLASYYLMQTNQHPSENELACINSAGTVRTAMCCLSAEDYPSTCLIGACGCSLENSHEVKFCDCGEGRCFNGNTCAMS
ncbi:MAG TPA: hypothetical protein VJ343_01545 [archaeon]|nr:hypothetical protein [archaeon]